VLAGFLDPFHLWGSRGYVAKFLKKKPERTDTATLKTVGQTREVEKGPRHVVETR
jgi:hypothetical protein